MCTQGGGGGGGYSGWSGSIAIQGSLFVDVYLLDTRSCFVTKRVQSFSRNQMLYIQNIIVQKCVP